MLFPVLAFILAACNPGEDKKAEESPESSVSAAPASFKMNCVILRKSQIQSWVDRGWTNPGNPDSLIRKILLQFYSANGNEAGNNMQLLATPGKNYLNVYPAGQHILEIDTTCTAMTVTGATIFGNNYADFSMLGITKADGTLKDFDFIRFKPARDWPPFINFKMEIVKLVGTQETITPLAKDGTDPCPLYCP